MRPETRYAKSGDVRVAYQVTGKGPLDLVWAPGTVSHLDLDWEWPPRARFFERLGSSFRLIRFDKRGTGLSDRPTNAATLEERMDDIRAVMDAAESERAVLFGLSEGGSMACLFAATYPTRTRALLLWGVQARWTQAPDYPWGPTREQQLRIIDEISEKGVTLAYITGPGYGLGAHPDPDLLEWCFRYSRAGGSPSAIAALERMVLEIDTRDVLPAIRVPTLVMNRTSDPVAHVSAARSLCSMIPGAKFLEWPGATHGFADLADQVIPAIQEFVAGPRSPPRFGGALATILCVTLDDGGPGKASEQDVSRQTLQAQAEELTRRITASYLARDVKRTREGFRAIFDGPSRAIQCAGRVQEALKELRLETRIGLHLGEYELVEDDVGGTTVRMAAQIATVARPGEILISSTIHDLVSWSAFRLEDRGSSSLSGFAETRHLFRVGSPGGGRTST
ncbi:MAG: adenylate/guanylate cyclase domain-containing protein [Thermoplasmata archaeon]